MSKDVGEEYRSSLADLTVNSKPLINMLTMLAEDYVEHAPIIVKAVEAHLQKVRGEVKLPVLYLIDSIVKNVGKDYVSLFTQNIVSNFCAVFEKVDEKIRAQMFKLRQTWNELFPPKKLYALDARVNAIDPAWPITAPQPTVPRIHVNPKFLNNPNQSTLPQSTSELQNVSILADGTIQEELLTKKKELLELQKRKVELELLQTKAILEEQQRKLESQTAALKSESSQGFTKKLGSLAVDNKTMQQPVISEPINPNTSFVLVPDVSQSQPFLVNERNILRRDPRRRIRPVNDMRNTVSNSEGMIVSKEKRSDLGSAFVDENKDDNCKSKVGRHFNISKRKLDRISKKHNRDSKSHQERRLFFQKANSSKTVDKSEKKTERNVDPLPVIEMDVETTPIQESIVPQAEQVESICTSVESSHPSSQIAQDNCKSKITVNTSSTSNSSFRTFKRKFDKAGRKHNREGKSHVGRKRDFQKDSSSSTDSPRKYEKKIEKNSEPPPPMIKMDVEVIPNEENSVPEFIEVESIPSEPSHPVSQIAQEKSVELPEITKAEPTPLQAPIPTKSESDVDLRLLLSPKSETDPPPEKKTKGEGMDKLFGESDVDLRTLPPPKPPTPPPPVISAISSPTDINKDDDSRCWANIKRLNPEFAEQQSSSKKRSGYQDFAGSKPWTSRPPLSMQHHHGKPLSSRDNFYNQRWSNKSHINNRHYDPKKPGFMNRYGGPGRIRNLRHPQDLPPADPAVLEMIESDPMAFVPAVNGELREVRFYGESAVIMFAWDDPRDLTFQSGCRRIIFDEVVGPTLNFNSSYRDYTLNDGVRIKIRLGAPTRELFIDGRFYGIQFGGAPIEISLKGRIHRIQLEGPIPYLKIGHVKRTDLVIGKVNLIVDANVKKMFPIYLDAKPQQFNIGGVPFILRFVEALQTVVINGRPFKVDFGGMPFPIYFQGEKHFLRMTHLPEGIIPGYVNILNMEGGRIPSPPPSNTLPPPPPLAPLQPPVPFPNQNLPIEPAPLPPPQPPYFAGPDKRFDLLSSLITSQNVPPFPVQSYNEQYPDTPIPMETNTSNLTTPNPGLTSNTNSGTMNLPELIQRLVESGIVPPAANKEKEDETREDKFAIKVVDFIKPETLKVRQPGLISKLYSGLQCGTCGVRFPPELSVKYSQHLDWHFRQNRKERDSSKIAISRRWNFDISDWIQYQEIEDIEDRAQSWFEIQEKKNSLKEDDEEDLQESTVPAKGFGEHPCCTVCQDRFDQFFNEEKEEWQLKRAVCIEDKLYHPFCYKDYSQNPPHMLPSLALTIQDEPPPPEIVETIDLDDSTPGVSSEDEKMKGVEVGDSDQNLDSESKTVSEIVEDLSKEGEEIEAIIIDKDEEANTSMDDDLVEVGVFQPVIEQYDILDDEDDETITLDEPKDEEIKDDDDDVIIEEDDVLPVKIKQETIDLSSPLMASQSNHPTETVTLDGNTELIAPTTVVIPKKIKITISSILPKSSTSGDEVSATTQDPVTNDVSSKLHTENTVSSQDEILEPLFSSEELCPIQIKPKIVENKLIDMPPISQGKEMSGLCSIM